ncbi:Maleylacetate reductase 1 [Nymphon striatum]|nr:Maleylacetate reductase 1 [Nymphon striatum]
MHQLRTPIAALRAQAELADEETDPEKQLRIVGKIHERSKNLSRLTDQLLNHAMIIHRADSVDLTPVDLRIVASEAVGQFDQSTFDAEHLVRMDLPEAPAMSDGDALSLVEACKNLINNAVTYETTGATNQALRQSENPEASFRPIALSPALLVGLDQHKRREFIARWRATFPNGAEKTAPPILPQSAKVLFGARRRWAVSEELSQAGFNRVLVLTTPRQQELGQAIGARLGQAYVGQFSGATMHTPVSVSEKAQDKLQELGADCVLSVGGGSTIGLGKALSARTGVFHAALPTTYE